jgi:hypothetical protein
MVLGGDLIEVRAQVGRKGADEFGLPCPRAPMNEDIHSFAPGAQGLLEVGSEDLQVLVQVRIMGQGKVRLGTFDKGGAEEAPYIPVSTGKPIAEARQGLDLASEGEVGVGIHPHQAGTGQCPFGIQGLSDRRRSKPEDPRQEGLKAAKAQASHLLEGILQAWVKAAQGHQMKNVPIHVTEAGGLPQPADVLGHAGVPRQGGLRLLRKVKGSLEGRFRREYLALVIIAVAPLHGGEPGGLDGIRAEVCPVAAFTEEPTTQVDEPQDPQAEDGVIDLRDGAMDRSAPRSVFAGAFSHGAS